MRWTALPWAILIALCCALPAEAKFVFRDGKWVFVADDDDQTSAATRPDTTTTEPEAPEPGVTPEPVPTPDPVVPPEPTPVPEPAVTGEPARLPATADPPSQPLAVETPDTGPAVATGHQPGRPDGKRTRIGRPGEPMVEIPDVEPAALELPATESVGEKYRHPEASRAADEAEGILARRGVTDDDADLIRRAIEAFRKGRYSRARSSAKRFLKKHPGSAGREAAQWLQAEALFSGQAYYDAYASYADFVKSFAGSDLAGKALRRQVECAEALLGPARRKVLGLPLLSGDEEALAMLEKVYARRPTGPLAADAIFRIAEYHLDHGNFEEGEEMLRKFLGQFPNHARSRQAELWSAQCAMASHNGPRYDDSALRRAYDTLMAYRNKYPAMAAQENVDGALQQIRHLRARKKVETAAYYRRAQRPKAAAFYARRVLDEYPGTPAAATARKILDELGAE